MHNFKKHFHIDLETYSEADLLKVSVVAYAAHPSTEITLAAYAYDDGPIELFDKAECDDLRPFEIVNRSLGHHEAIIKALNDPDVLLIAWNVPFEREVLRAVWGIDTPAERWLDAMVVAYSLSLPGSLGAASIVLSIPEDKAKQTDGRRLIRKFCKPQPKNQKLRRRDWNTDPEDWDKFGAYCRTDVEAERFALKRMWKYRPPEHEVDLWHLDQKINQHGAPIDLDLVTAAQDVADTLKTELKKECAILTGLENPNSREQFLEYIQGEGYPSDSLTKDKVDIALREGGISSEGVQALALRSQFSKNSVAKYQKIEQQTVDGRLRYTLQFAGAGRTWRWSGRGAQFHNLPRPPKVTKTPEAMRIAVEAIKRRDAAFLRIMYDHPIDVLAGAIRPTLKAPKGKVLKVSDYNAIENRVLGWVTRCPAILDVFKNHLDPYKDFALKMFTHFYERPHHPEYEARYNEITGEQRTQAKPAVLGAGYMLGGGKLMPVRKAGQKTGEMMKTGLWAYAEALGVEMTKEESHHAVDTFRDTYTEVVDFWDTIDRAVRKTIERRPEKPIRIPVGFADQYLEIGYKKPFMYIRLPSGRCLWYMRPQVKRCAMPWENADGSQAYGLGVVYEGVNQQTNKWGEVTTHKGKLTENVVQAIARDILANGIINADADGFDVVLHVHDEVVTEVDIADDDHTVERLNTVLCDMPTWADDMPMRAEGFETPFYIKD